MKAKAKYKIQELHQIYSALNEIANGAGSNFQDMSEKDLFLNTMQRVTGRVVSKETVQKVITELNGA